MSVAREQLIGRINAIHAILANQVAVDTTPVATPSSAAVTVRNGCMVMLFCALEGFIRARSLECARAIDQTAVPYTHLPAGLKTASLIATFEGLMNLARGYPVADKIAEFERASVAVAAGALGSAYQFTEYSFARDKSNVASEDVGKITKAFGVDNFWNAARSVAAKAGMALPGNMDDLFKQLARERHKAAHVASHNVPHSFLTAALPTTLALALTFDTLISKATVRLSASGIAQGTSPRPVTDADVNFVTVKQHRGTQWGAFLPTGTRALFVEATQELAYTRAASTARTKSLELICLDSAGRASNWRTALG